MAKRTSLTELVKRLDSPDARVVDEARIELMERLDEEEASEAEVVPAAAAILAAYAKRRTLVRNQEGDGSEWRWEESYTVLREQTELLLDLIGVIPTQEAVDLLQDALGFRDPLLKFWALHSLLRRGQDVEPTVLRELAAEPVTRIRLAFLLEDVEKFGLFPAEFATQEAYAQSEMIDWLADPDSMGRPPDEIALMEVVTQDFGEEHGQGDFYVFRFRMLPPHEGAEQGWMSGIAGPYLRAEEPTPHSYGFTYSEFRPADEMSPEELVNEVQQLFGEFEGDEEDGEA
jgi:hypothetical protein